MRRQRRHKEFLYTLMRDPISHSNFLWLFFCHLLCYLNHNSNEMNLYWPKMSKILLWMAPTVWDFFAAFFLLPQFSLFATHAVPKQHCYCMCTYLSMCTKKQMTRCLRLLLLLLNIAKQGLNVDWRGLFFRKSMKN